MQAINIVQIAKNTMNSALQEGIAQITKVRVDQNYEGYEQFVEHAKTMQSVMPLERKEFFTFTSMMYQLTREQSDAVYFDMGFDDGRHNFTTFADFAARDQDKIEKYEVDHNKLASEGVYIKRDEFIEMMCEQLDLQPQVAAEWADKLKVPATLTAEQEAARDAYEAKVKAEEAEEGTGAV